MRDFKPGGYQGSSNSSARNSKVGILTNIDEPFKMIKIHIPTFLSFLDYPCRGKHCQNWLPALEYSWVRLTSIIWSHMKSINRQMSQGMSRVASLWQASSIWIAWGFQMCQMCTGCHRSHNVRPKPVQPDPDKGKFLGNERRPGADQTLFSTSQAENIWRIRGHTCMHALLIYIYYNYNIYTEHGLHNATYLLLYFCLQTLLGWSRVTFCLLALSGFPSYPWRWVVPAWALGYPAKGVFSEWLEWLETDDFGLVIVEVGNLWNKEERTWRNSL